MKNGFVEEEDMKKRREKGKGWGSREWFRERKLKEFLERERRRKKKNGEKN